MPQAIEVKVGKVEVPSSDLKAAAEKAALAAAKKAVGGTKFEKRYEVTLAVKVEHDKKDSSVKATDTFTITEGGKLVPRLAVSKSGVATVKFKGDKIPPAAVADAVDGIVDSTMTTLVKTLGKLEEMEKKGK